MPDYQQGKIYKLWSPEMNLVYYGSTVQSLPQRLAKHKNQYNINNNGYCTSFLILDCEDYKMELMEEYPCNNRQQLEKKEGEYIKANKCVNKQIAGRTIKEYRKDNKDKRKEYLEANKDKIAEQKKEYYEINKEQIKQQRKEHREANKDKINEKRKEHREANKEAFNAYQKQYREKLKQNKNINL
jgi:hypothetical protein